MGAVGLGMTPGIFFLWIQEPTRSFRVRLSAGGPGLVHGRNQRHADLGSRSACGGAVLYEWLVPIYEDGKVAHEQLFNHPPMIIAVLSVWGWLEERTGIPMGVWLRGTSALT